MPSLLSNASLCNQFLQDGRDRGHYIGVTSNSAKAYKACIRYGIGSHFRHAVGIHHFAPVADRLHGQAL